ncbi:Mov34/MPN/PAD-1 family protein [Mycobacteroides abscessus]|uniref:Mov34/MPN/PAD-1 family protein n=1 Tax=Mycobacteroides abscessus TaxID=36809 RepID=UPI00266C3518|nr:Mov34/MPN/PAD-1 family protein [Mycobacteroides abscessus]MDO3175907.1 Mov34/MPN/PAD-1 family protein [Mycobacteroides abscessus subsp. abscessus]
MRPLLAKLLKRQVTVRLHEAAVALIQESAVRAAPAETGGILLGWWEAGTIVIDAAVEVVDDSATGNSWTRREAAAQNALDAALNEAKNRDLGYVGDWHCHPAPVGASRTDLKSLSRSSVQYQNPLALLVRLPDSTVRVYAADHGILVDVQLNP